MTIDEAAEELLKLENIDETIEYLESYTKCLFNIALRLTSETKEQVISSILETKNIDEYRKDFLVNAVKKDQVRKQIRVIWQIINKMQARHLRQEHKRACVAKLFDASANLV